MLKFWDWKIQIEQIKDVKLLEITVIHKPPRKGGSGKYLEMF